MADELLEKLKTLLEEESYAEAVEILPEIKESRAKTSSDFIALAKANGKAGNFERAEKCYLKAYKLRPSKLLLRDITELSIECGRMKEALKYYDEYKRALPGDVYNLLVTRYKIEKKTGAKTNTLISTLCEINDFLYSEKYAYELAKLYHKSGMKDECINECVKIVEHFEMSPTVRKAATLLAYHNGELTEEQIVSAGAAASVRSENENTKHKIDSFVFDETAPLPELSEEVMAQVPDFAGLQEEDEEDEEEVNFSAYETPAQEIIPDPLAVSEIAKGVRDIINEEDEPKQSEVPSDIIPQKEEELKRDFKSAVQERSQPTYDCYEPVKENTVVSFRNGRLKKEVESRGINLCNIFKFYMDVQDTQRSILNCLELVVNEKGPIFLVITGGERGGKSTLAIRMIKALFELGIVKENRTAKIDAEVLNEINIADKAEEIRGCNFLVENAGALFSSKLEELVNFVEQQEGVAVILEGDLRSVNTLIRTNPKFSRGFNKKIHLPKFDMKELMKFAVEILAEEDYSIEKHAAVVLEDMIREKAFRDDRRLGITADIVNRAVDNADKRLAPDILKMAAEAAFENYSNLVILESDLRL